MGMIATLLGYRLTSSGRDSRFKSCVPCRKQHKKDQVTEVSRKKRRNTGKATARSIVGASLEVINKRRTEKPEVSNMQLHPGHAGVVGEKAGR